MFHPGVNVICRVFSNNKKLFSVNTITQTKPFSFVTIPNQKVFYLIPLPKQMAFHSIPLPKQGFSFDTTTQARFFI